MASGDAHWAVSPGFRGGTRVSLSFSRVRRTAVYALFALSLTASNAVPQLRQKGAGDSAVMT